MSHDFGNVWTFKAGRFAVRLTLEPDYGYQYDGDDQDGETQAALDAGDYVAFDSKVSVELDGEEIAASYLGGSVYDVDQVKAFYTDHRSADPMNRNCSEFRIARGGSADARVSICHYFPDMVREAIDFARTELRRRRDTMPYIREAA